MPVSRERDRLLPARRRRRDLDDVDHVVFYDKPFLKFERLLETYLAFAPRGFTSFRHGDAAMAAGKAVPEGPAQRGAGEAWASKSSWNERLLFSRTPPEPCGERVLSRRRSKKRSC